VVWGPAPRFGPTVFGQFQLLKQRVKVKVKKDKYYRGLAKFSAATHVSDVFLP
jgi:hypothetical protein